MKRLLITGTLGHIGAVLKEELEGEYELFLLDKEEVDWDNFTVLDLSSHDKVLDYFEELDNLDCVIHLAADPRVNASWSSVLENNIIPTYNVFKAVRKNEIGKIIFASSNHTTGMYEEDTQFEKMIYEGIDGEKISIEDELRPDSLYGVSKIFGEQLGKYYSENFGISVICLRIGTFNEEDKPLEERHRATWISHRDFLDLVKKSVENEKVNFGVYYGVSDNERRIWSIENARKELEYNPQDDAEEYWENS